MTTTRTNRPRPATVVAGAIIVALEALGNVGSVAAPLPIVVRISGLLLAAVAIAALAGIWLHAHWGRWLGAASLVGTILAAAPGILFAPTQGIFIVAIVAVGMAVIGVVLLILPTSRDGLAAASAAGRE